MSEPVVEPETGRRGPAPWQVVALTVVLCLLSGFVGWWIAQPDADSFNDVDVGFLSDMTAHHQGAISLSFDYLRREHDSLVGHFARDIVLSQTQEVTIMNSLLTDAGNPRSADDEIAMDWMGMAVDQAQMPGMPTDAEVASLRSATGLDADDQFTRLMIRHHAAGAAMAEYAAAHGENDKVTRMAAAMARVQRTEILEMEARRSALGLPRVDTADLDQMADHGAH